jgi:hypothetical protein
MRLIKKDAKMILTTKFQEKTKHRAEENQYQLHENVKNEARRDACKKRNCSKSEKISNQTDQRNDEKSSFHIC